MGQKLTRPDEYKKAAILLAVRGGTMSRVNACRTYMISSDEFRLAADQIGGHLQYGHLIDGTACLGSAATVQSTAPYGEMLP